jgi:hypothetical protein
MHWVIKYCTLYKDARRQGIHCELAKGTKVTATGKTSGDMSEVSYWSSNKILYGWIYTDYIEEIIQDFSSDAVIITDPTPNPNDANQYAVIDGKIQYNLCGVLSVAWLANVSDSDVMTKWQALPNSLYKSSFKDGLLQPLGIPALKEMLGIYSISTLPLSQSLYSKPAGRALLSPVRLQNLGRCIIGVKISGTDGELKATGTPHWVVVESIEPDEVNAGWVVIYNPFPNKLQRYSWRQFEASIGSNPFGLVVTNPI